jgi:hypothetical protein
MTTRGKKAVAEKKDALPVIAGLDEFMGQGAEEVQSTDLAIPFLRLVQSNSPIVKKANPEYNPEASEGDILNTATGQLWSGDEGIVVLPVFYKREKLEFVLQSDGGGFVAAHPGTAEFRTERNENNRDVIVAGEPGEGHEILDTAQFFVVAVPDDGDPFVAMIGMSRTQMKYAKRWLTGIVQQYNGAQPPMWMFKWRLTARYDHKDDNSWASWNIAKEGGADAGPWFTDVQDPLFQFCAATYRSIKGGEAKVDRSQMAEPTGSDDDEEDTPAY